MSEIDYDKIVEAMSKAIGDRKPVSEINTFKTKWMPIISIVILIITQTITATIYIKGIEHRVEKVEASTDKLPQTYETILLMQRDVASLVKTSEENKRNTANRYTKDDAVDDKEDLLTRIISLEAKDGVHDNRFSGIDTKIAIIENNTKQD